MTAILTVQRKPLGARGAMLAKHEAAVPRVPCMVMSGTHIENARAFI